MGSFCWLILGCVSWLICLCVSVSSVVKSSLRRRGLTGSALARTTLSVRFVVGQCCSGSLGSRFCGSVLRSVLACIIVRIVLWWSASASLMGVVVSSLLTGVRRSTVLARIIVLAWCVARSLRWMCISLPCRARKRVPGGSLTMRIVSVSMMRR